MKRLDFIWVLLFMAFIGALIGGFTNHLAIRMLFRPHEAKYIGKWRLPFTPGLIPKRREELAQQLGKTVTQYLLTPETFRKKLLTPEMEKKTATFLQQKMTTYLFQSEKTLSDWLAMVGASQAADKAEDKVLQLVHEQLQKVRHTVTNGTIEEVVPDKWLAEVEQRIPHFATYILERGEHYFASFEGKMLFRQLIDDFLASKGTFGGMVQMLFGESESLVGKVQAEAIKFVTAPGTNNLLQNMLQAEWEKLQKKPMDELTQSFDWDGLFEKVLAYAKKEMSIADRLDQRIIDYWPTGADWTEAHLVPKLVVFLFDQAEKQLELSLSKLKLDVMVKEQVDSFPVSILEDLVLGISKREFKMITVLGALLGGLIGLVQGCIVFFTNLT